jgi:hypothetical protein
MKKFIQENFALFCFGLLIFTGIIGGSLFPMEYFTNSNIDRLYLNQVNRDFSKFLFAFPVFLIIVFFVAYNIRKNPSSTINILGPTVFLLIYIPEGFVLLLNTHNFWQPDLSTFNWNSWQEYSQYTRAYKWVSLILYFVLIIFLQRKFGNFNSKKAEQNQKLTDHPSTSMGSKSSDFDG